MQMISMAEGSFKDALTAWNESFADYSVNVTMTMEQFIKTMAAKRLAPEYSFIAYDDQRPVGIILNSIQHVDGKWMAYNGGTAVHSDIRKQGVGHQLVDASLRLFKEKQVEVATLEAISHNHQAIHLYEQHGYEVTDKLATLKSVFPDEKAENRLAFIPYSYQEWRKLDFPEASVPWQNKIPFITEREIYVMEDNHVPVGYAVLARHKEGQVTAFQLQGMNGQVRYEDLYTCMANHFPGYEVVAFNVPHKHPSYKEYEKLNYERIIEQVWMEKKWV